jgi:hypothetical protein
MTIQTQTSGNGSGVPVKGSDDDDPAGIAGMLIGMAAIACWLLGIMMPVLPWIRAGLLGMAALVCAILSHSQLRWWVLAIAILSFIPPILFILVQLVPSMQR